MPSDTARRLQETFLGALKAQRSQATIFLSNGVKLQGAVVDFDNFCISLERDNLVQAVYKSAISTIVPLGPIDLRDDDHPKPAARPQPSPPARAPKTFVVERRGRPRSPS